MDTQETWKTIKERKGRQGLEQGEIVAVVAACTRLSMAAIVTKSINYCQFKVQHVYNDYVEVKTCTRMHRRRIEDVTNACLA